MEIHRIPLSRSSVQRTLQLPRNGIPDFQGNIQKPRDYDFAAFINFGVNIGCVRFVGLQAASFSTFAAYLFLFLIRIRHSQRYFTLDIEWGKNAVWLMAVLLSMVLTFVVPGLWLCFLMELAALVVFIKANYNIIRPYIKRLMRR